VADVLAAFPDRRDVLLSVLHDVQNTGQGKSWITDEEANQIARHFHMPLAELDGVISFYKMFSREKRGAHIIRLCDSLSCHVCGSLDLYRHLRDKVGDMRSGMTDERRQFHFGNSELPWRLRQGAESDDRRHAGERPLHRGSRYLLDMIQEANR